MTDERLGASPWNTPETVAGFTASPPNATLMRYAQDVLHGARFGRALDIGCGAARNALPLAAQGWNVFGVDLSRPMLDAANGRAREAGLAAKLRVILSPMDRLPIASASCDLVIAHGIWNLARSGAEFRRAIREAARVAVPGAALFVFTFSRNTFAASLQPIAGETFVYTQFSGAPQCFVTDDQLIEELGQAGFVSDAAVPIHELNRPLAGAVPLAGGPPVIYEAAFRYAG